MENDFLAFRFPDREINAWIGELTLNSLDNAKDSFVFSDFEAKKTYIFRKCNEVNLPFSFDYHVNDELPYCVTSREYILQAHSLLNAMNQLNIDKVVSNTLLNVLQPKRFSSSFSRCSVKARLITTPPTS